MNDAKPGIDILGAGRPGGVPTHVVGAPAGPTATSAAAMGKLTRAVNGPNTIDPFAAFGRFRKRLANRLGQ